MKKILLSLAAFAGILQASAVTPEFSWGKSLFADKFQTSIDRNILSDDGNIFFSGLFKTTATISWGDDRLSVEAQTSTVDFNYALMKVDSDGNLIWTIYSKVGNFKTNSTNVAATSDGGAVVVARVRHNLATWSDENLLELVDAKGTVTAIAGPENNGLRQDYGLVMRVSKDGEILWNQILTQGSVCGEKTGVVDAFTISGVTVDDNDDLFIGGRYITPLTLPGDVVLPAGKNIPATVATTISVGDSWIAKLDGDTGLTVASYYAGSENAAKYADSDEVKGLVWSDGTLYVGSLVKGLADTEAGLFGKVVTPVAYQQPVLAAINADAVSGGKFPDAVYVKNYPSNVGKTNGVTVQINGMTVENNAAYILGSLKGSIDADGVAIATAGAPLEGYYLKADVADGVLVGAGIAGNSISDFRAIIDDVDAQTVYALGYNLSAGYMLEPFATATPVAQAQSPIYLATSAGMIGIPSASFNNDTKQLVISARSNTTPSFYGTEQTGTEGISVYSAFGAAFRLPGVNSGSSGVTSVESDDADAPAEYFTLQGVRVDNPSAGLYIVRRGSKVTKEIIR